MTRSGQRTLNAQATPVAGPASPAAGGSCTPVQDIVNTAATLEAFGVTFLGEALASADRGDLPLNAEALGTLKAARAAEQAHFDTLTEMGAEPLTTEFTIPDPELFSNVGTFFEALITIEEAAIAAYIAAAQEFSIQGEGEMARLALQIGTVEAEHRAGARFFAIAAGEEEGTPNDVAFERALFGSVSEAAAALEEQGFIGGDGETISFPGPGDIDATGVTNLEP